MSGSERVDPEIGRQAVEDLRRYKEEHKMPLTKLARMIGAGAWSVKPWLNGEYLPSPRFICAMQEQGITNVKMADDVQDRAVTLLLKSKDKLNEPRQYRKRVMMPDIVSNQMKLLIDDYVEGLDTPKTFNEFKDNRNDFINKLYYTCKQGE